MNIKVTVVRSGTPVLEQMSTRLQKASLSENLAKEFAKQVKIAISQRVNSASGAGTKHLMRSITVISDGKNSRSSRVVGADYYWHANFGRKAGRPPPIEGKLAAWAAKSNKWSGPRGAKRLAKHIAETGTEGKFFHQVAEARFKNNKSKIIKNAIGIK